MSNTEKLYYIFGKKNVEGFGRGIRANMQLLKNISFLLHLTREHKMGYS